MFDIKSITDYTVHAHRNIAIAATVRDDKEWYGTSEISLEEIEKKNVYLMCFLTSLFLFLTMHVVCARSQATAHNIICFYLFFPHHQQQPDRYVVVAIFSFSPCCIWKSDTAAAVT